MALCGEHRSHQLLGRRWCPAGTHLVIATRESESAGHLLRVSTFRGTQLLGSFTLGGGCCFKAVSAGACSIFAEPYKLDRSGLSGVLAATPDGTITARHIMVPCTRWQLSGDGSSLLGVSRTGEALYVCPAAAGMQTIDLRRTVGLPGFKRSSFGTRISSRDGLAIVTKFTNSHSELLFVDLAGLRVVHRQALPPRSVCDIAQGSRSAALWDYDCGLQTTVVATGTDAEAGRQLFVVPGGDFECVAWNALGRHLAVASIGRVTVYDGLSGAALASWSTSAAAESRLQLSSVRWLPDGAGLVCMVQARSEGFTKVSCVLLRFAGSAERGL